MKTKLARRVISSLLTFVMVAALMPATASAAEPVDSSPGGTEMNFEYLNSTLYNWDEDAANAATAALDVAATTTVEKVTSTDRLDRATKWTFTKNDDGTYTISTDGGYLTWTTGSNAGDARLTDTPVRLSLEAAEGYSKGVTISQSSGTYNYLNYYNASQCGGWYDGDSDEGNIFYIASNAVTSNSGWFGTTINTDNAVNLDEIENGEQYYIVSYRGLQSSSQYLNLTTDSMSADKAGFYFTSANNVPDGKPSYSNWDDASQNYKIYSGLAADRLSESDNAPFADGIVAADLFATDGSNNSYTTVYTNARVPFVYDESTGYYTLDSDKYGVYIPSGASRDGATLAIADRPSAYASDASSGLGDIVGIAPFNTLINRTMQGKNSSNTPTRGYQISGSMDYGFGMVTSVDFQMTDDGMLNGEPIQFKFSGDDDVWVYIDGVLVLDIGGTHDAITGVINFADGSVMLDSNGYNQIGDKATGDIYGDSDENGTLSQTNMYTALGTTRAEFSARGNHTLTIYYMDRGRGKTNCLIEFNLPQRDSVSVTKNISGTYLDDNHEVMGADGTIPDDVMRSLNNIDFSFTLYDSAGTVANKSYSLYDSSGSFLSTGSTDNRGRFSLKNGQTATFRGISLDSESSYYVVENLATGTGTRWETEVSETSSVSGADYETVTLGENETGTASDKVTVTGSPSSADTISFVFTNSYQKGPDPDVDIYDDTIVLDYGLPVSVDVMGNDVITLYGAAITDGDQYNTEIKLGLAESYETGTDDDGNQTVTVTPSERITGTYGYAEIKDGEIVYTLTDDFHGIETIQYYITASADVQNGETDPERKSTTAVGTLTIIPATSVYYEENFGPENDSLVSVKTNTGTYEPVGTAMSGYQEAGYVGNADDSTYGTDAYYLDNLGDSNGTSLKADTTDGAVQYSYSFTGMGTSIYGRVSDVTGYIQVKVTDSSGKVVDTQYIDTINMVTPTDEEDGGQILDSVLYNIPIYQNTRLDNGYDTYKVTIYVYKSGTGNMHEKNNEFYLDGIRVFQPMGTSEENENAGEEEYSAANTAYATDGEQNAAVVNIREKIVADYGEGYVYDIFTLTDVNGQIGGVEDYNAIGPNQEVYLKEGYSLNFALVNWDTQSYKIYLGMKAPNGEEAEATVGESTFTLKNSMDCYYDISGCVDVETDYDEDGNEYYIGYVTIEGISGLSALTNIKVTGVDEFNLAYGQDGVFDSEDFVVDDGGESDENTYESIPTIYLVSRETAESLGEEEETPVFTPDSIAANCNYASKTKRATVNVVTSKDVAYVTIDGVEITGKNVSGKLRFTKSYTKVSAGKTFEVIAYNADGTASETYTVTAE